jgi:hypothetical protein
MKMRYKAILIGTIITLAITLAYGQVDSSGEYGFKFLSIPTDPASLALAGRAPDGLSVTSAFAIQPAISTIDKQRSVGVSHTKWLQETDFTNVYYSYSTRRNHFGLLLRNLSYGTIEKRDEAGNIIGSYSPLDLGVMANYSLRITPSQYLGLNAGVLYEKLATASSIGLSTDLGYTWLPPIADTKLSLAIRNIGLSTKMNDEAIDLPLLADLDLSKGISINEARLLVGASVSKPIDEELKGTVHSELSYRDLLYLRAGYRINYSGNALSAGLGIRYQNFGVDYGWADSVDELSSIHSLALSYHF